MSVKVQRRRNIYDYSSNTCKESKRERTNIDIASPDVVAQDADANSLLNPSHTACTFERIIFALDDSASHVAYRNVTLQRIGDQVPIDSKTQQARRARYVRRMMR